VSVCVLCGVWVCCVVFGGCVCVCVCVCVLGAVSVCLRLRPCVSLTICALWHRLSLCVVCCCVCGVFCVCVCCGVVWCVCVVCVCVLVCVCVCVCVCGVVCVLFQRETKVPSQPEINRGQRETRSLHAMSADRLMQTRNGVNRG